VRPNRKGRQWRDYNGVWGSDMESVWRGRARVVDWRCGGGMVWMYRCGLGASILLMLRLQLNMGHGGLRECMENLGLNTELKPGMLYDFCVLRMICLGFAQGILMR
jgi:hypothetical protein